MSLHLTKQISGSIFQAANNWDMALQKEISSLKAPDYLMGPRVDVLQGDISREWYKWIIDQFLDKKFFTGRLNFFEIFQDVQKSIEVLVGNQKDADDKNAIAKEISNMILNRVQFLTSDLERRRSMGISVKEDLLDIYGPNPRCWLTGFEFSDKALSNFTAKTNEKVKLDIPKFVDKFRPIGTIERDLSIEIDHLHPYSLGGQDDLSNYRLICGWANRVKSNHISGYSTGTRVTGKNKLYSNSFFYWVIRTIGLKRKCEVAGCKSTIENSELTVCSQLGSDKVITPVSMMVVCKNHPGRADRLVKIDQIKELFYT